MVDAAHESVAYPLAGNESGRAVIAAAIARVNGGIGKLDLDMHDEGGGRGWRGRPLLLPVVLVMLVMLVVVLMMVVVLVVLVTLQNRCQQGFALIHRHGAGRPSGLSLEVRKGISEHESFLSRRGGGDRGSIELRGPVPPRVPGHSGVQWRGS